ncbi:MAG TPA: type II toxin-antitoxin system RelE/ParE family toxin [Blastocatellia bacterium]|nr:type II toxin-antitoxin system RelE/ParE family toxin [Blastocatellia bacterium]
MAYVVHLKRSAEKELASLPTKIHDKVVKGLTMLKQNPRPVGAKKLQAREGYRIRIGDYRVLYVVDDEQSKVDVFSIAHRKEVYRLR